jgi:hypothetical protein
MDNDVKPGTTLYVSISVDKGQVKTSASAYLTASVDRAREEVEPALAEAVAASLAVACMATQSVNAMLATPMDPAVIDAFVDRVGRIAGEIAASHIVERATRGGA